MTFIDDFEDRVERELEHIDNLHDLGIDVYNEDMSIDHDELMTAFTEYEQLGENNG